MNYYLVEYNDHDCDDCNQSSSKTFLLETPKEYVTKDFNCYGSNNNYGHEYMYFKKVISDHRSALNFYFESVSESVFQKRYDFDKNFEVIE